MIEVRRTALGKLCFIKPSLESKSYNYPWQRMRAFLIAQLVKNLPVMQEPPSLIPGSGRSPGEGKGHPFQYSWASLVSQLAKNLPAVQEI